MNPTQIAAIQRSLRLANILTKKRNANKSISRLSKDTIIEYPVIISDAIEAKDMMEIVKNLERQMAVMLVIYFSTNNVVNTNNYGNISEYIRSFHNESPIPVEIKNLSRFETARSTESFTESDKKLTYEITNTTISDAPKYLVDSNYATESLKMPHNEINPNKVNDIFRPFKALEFALTKTNTATPAMEASTKDLGKAINSGINPHLDRHDREYPGVVNSPSGVVGPMNRGFNVTQLPTNINKNGLKIVEPSKEYATLAPTMVECEFILTNSGTVFGSGSSNYMTMKATFGVKAIARRIDSNTFVSNIVSGISNSGIFKFIKWTKGEIGVIKDVLFGVSDAKQDALINRSAAKVFSNLHRLKRANAIGKLTGANVPATTVIVMTEYEVEQVRQTTGVDLNDRHEAGKFMNNQFLLGFAIYNTETGTMKYMFDSYDDWHHSSMSTMMQSNKKQDTAIKSLTDAMKTIF